MSKPQFVGAAIDDARPLARRALGGAVCQHWTVRPRHIAELIGAAAAAAFAIPIAPVPFVHAAGCPDAEVVFARGTTEAPGVGPTGEAFVDALRTQVGAKSVGVYAVDYPATTDFPTAVEGIADARTHVLSTAANCPHTKMVLGGFSQGAAVMGFVTANAVPDGVSPADVPAPMPPDVANHIAAVALFGKPSTRFMHAINRPADHDRIAVCGQDHRLVCRQRPGLRFFRQELLRAQPVRRDRDGRPGSSFRRESTPGQLGGRCGARPLGVRRQDRSRRRRLCRFPHL